MLVLGAYTKAIPNINVFSGVNCRKNLNVLIYSASKWKHIEIYVIIPHHI